MMSLEKPFERVVLDDKASRAARLRLRFGDQEFEAEGDPSWVGVQLIEFLKTAGRLSSPHQASEPPRRPYSRHDLALPRRRFTETKPLRPESIKPLEISHPALTERRTLFPSTVTPVAELRNKRWDRFAVRTSVADLPGHGPFATTISFVPETPTVSIGASSAIICPAQTGATECCGSCGLCWSEAARNKPIAFVLHGKRGRNKLVRAA